MKSHALTGAVLATVAVCIMGCSVFRSGPAATVKTFYRDVEKGEITEAMGLLSSQVRAGFGDQKIRAALAQQAEGIKQQHKGIQSLDTKKEEILGEMATVTTLITYVDTTTQTDVTKLVLEDSHWKISPSK